MENLQIKEQLALLGITLDPTLPKWVMPEDKDVVVYVKVGIAAQKYKVKSIDFYSCHLQDAIFVETGSGTNCIFENAQVSFFEVDGKREVDTILETN